MSGHHVSAIYCLVVLLGFACTSVDPGSSRAPLQTLSSASRPTVNLMGPLVIGDPRQPQGKPSEAAWRTFERQLATFRQLGVNAITTDVWWGLIEPQDNAFRWDYYHRLAKTIDAQGLRWIPILSFHQCGGNVGDSCDIKLPAWLWHKYSSVPGVGGADGLKFQSEQGNISSEVISVWGSGLAAVEFEEVMADFQIEFAAYAKRIPEINISLGPAGELRYPSYNSHDVGVDYPNRGALQSYSPLAQASFRQFLERRHGSVTAAQRYWGKSERQLFAPESLMPRHPATFISAGFAGKTRYGTDFFDWYQGSLFQHGRRLLRSAGETFNAPGAAFRGIDIGAKIPGLHWRLGREDDRGAVVFGDRGAELPAGLIPPQPSHWQQPDRGYGEILKMFRELDGERQGLSYVLHFTCLEMNNGDGPAEAQSLAKSLVQWIGTESRRLGLRVKGENALGFLMGNDWAWDNIDEALAKHGYEGVTILRMDELAGNPLGLARLRQLTGKSLP